MPARIRPRGAPPPQYGPLEERFSVEINHGGMFCGYGTNKTYVDCQTDYFDDCEVETWSPLWIRDFLLELGIDAERMQVVWKLPGKGFADGLRIIASDSDTLMMTAVVPKFQLFRLFVTEKDLFDGLGLDDICILGSPDLPAIISPKQMSKRAGSSQVVVKAGSDDDDDSNYGDEFVDSDNEIDKDDDDIFEEWVDREDTSNKKGTEWVDDDYDSDDLDLPPSDSEYEEDEVEVEEETKEQDGEGSIKKKKKKEKKESAASTDDGIENSQSTVQQALILQSQTSQQSRVLMPLPESSFIARSKAALPTTNLQSIKQRKKRGAKPKK